MHRFLGLAAGLFLTCAATQAAASANCVAPSNVNALATEIAAGVNANRRAQGEAPLRFNRRLGQAAMVHACDMQVNDFFDHRGTDGSNSQRRVRNAGYDDCIVAENIAWGYPQPERIVTGWMNSPGHRRNMMHPRIEEFGIGITQGPKGPYWVLVVGKQC
ncbi:CAP domain-containing protein [Cognatiyoonia sp. IB215182]|uniref:CAP domain-containing protein n=1 Tax=Cognatiyoonia sp. IB215182 TaxID=3097353 RepID=UPI002A15D288|nr:CAP domain-containing protein [Cognatiyoonia sp. IB215182]MDX8351025.1 CAP domain-containing protein [Cognatiyoonia sp. IB215182]